MRGASAEETGVPEAEAGRRRRKALPADVLRGEPRLRSWRPGDRLTPFGMDGHKKISDLLREAGVPARLRRMYVLVEDDEGPFWLIGVSRAERTRMLPSTATAVTLLIHGWRPDGAEGE